MSELKPCPCINWCRDSWPIGLPPSNHHPNCEQYKLNQYAKLKYNGTWYVTKLETVCDELKDLIRCGDHGQGDTYEIEIVEMTQDQYDNLPEFIGF